ncbi:hypothetical protein ACFQ9Y_01275 [Peribacillus simplex]|uniref:hypothetical protein n=1 Tax=Peribacillus simplex TaxID=1478 RepID=UPI00366CFD93
MFFKLQPPFLDKLHSSLSFAFYSRIPFCSIKKRLTLSKGVTAGINFTNDDDIESFNKTEKLMGRGNGQ